MRIRRFLTAMAVGVATLVSALTIAPAPAQAATTWSLSNTNGDVYGAWAHGSYWWSGGRLYLQVSVKDTIADGYSASVELLAHYNDGGMRYETVVNSGGKGTTVTKTYSFAGNVIAIVGYECASFCTGWGGVY